MDIPVNSSGQVYEFPATQLENGDRIVIPPKPSFVQVIGVVNTESALLYRKGATVKDYLAISGVGSSADVNGAILVRINGKSITNGAYCNKFCSVWNISAYSKCFKYKYICGFFFDFNYCALRYCRKYEAYEGFSV